PHAHRAEISAARGRAAARRHSSKAAPSGFPFRAVETPGSNALQELWRVEHSDGEQNSTGNEIVDVRLDANRAQAGAQNAQRQYARSNSERTAAAADDGYAAGDRGRGRRRQHIGERDGRCRAQAVTQQHAGQGSRGARSRKHSDDHPVGLETCDPARPAIAAGGDEVIAKAAMTKTANAATLRTETRPPIGALSPSATAMFG